MKNIAPNIKRKRLIFEGIYSDKIKLSKEDIEQFLVKLTNILGMNLVYGPIVNNWTEQYNPERYAAFEGWVMWAESGAQFYSWEKSGKLITVDAFTCKDFDEKIAVNFIKEWFDCKEFEYLILPKNQQRRKK